jgi:hypothetical protein
MGGCSEVNGERRESNGEEGDRQCDSESGRAIADMSPIGDFYIKISNMRMPKKSNSRYVK